MSIPSAWSQYFPPRPEWSVDDTPDQTGKVFLITGGTSGLGARASSSFNRVPLYVSDPHFVSFRLGQCTCLNRRVRYCQGMTSSSCQLVLPESPADG